jgi:hypothetical protein
VNLEVADGDAEASANAVAATELALPYSLRAPA